MFKKIDYSNIPENVAIIMDGNGRYALSQGLGARYFGHSKGVDALRNIISRAYELRIKYLTVYAFSTENWERDEKEIAEIFKLLMKFLKNYEKELAGRSIRIKPIGDITKLPEDVQKELANVADKTKNNDKMIFNVALNYGGRDEILRACNKFLCHCGLDPQSHSESLRGDSGSEAGMTKGGIQKDREASISRIKSEEELNEYMDAPEIDNIDLVIRTSGENRISNFLLWQSAYAEYYFTSKLWPAFKPKDLDKAIIEYQRRNRRLGR